MFSEYYAKLQMSKTGCPHAEQFQTLARSVPQESRDSGNHRLTSSSTSSSSTWSSNPLMVTTIVSLSIAVVATLVILPLVLCVQVRQRCAGKPIIGGPVTGGHQAGARSPSSAAYDAVEKGRMPSKSLPTSPIYVPPNGFGEKSGS